MNPIQNFTVSEAGNGWERVVITDPVARLTFSYFRHATKGARNIMVEDGFPITPPVNRALRSQEFDSGAWLKANATVAR